MANFAEVVRSLRQVFRTGRTKTYEWRYAQLSAMLKMMDDNKDRITAALKKDLNKHKIESLIFEFNLCRNELILTLNNLKEWMKPEKVKKELLNVMDKCYIQREPYGLVLILGAWNYPIQLTILPMIASISAGNCVIVKPSEMSEQTAILLEEIVPKYLDNECIKVINGGVPETTGLLQERFDYIFYTGNNVVAKIVMAAAAKNLTPVTLELGGKSPVYVDRNCDLTTVARRLVWGKFVNAGQTCIAPDYVMCPSDVQDPLIEEMRKVLVEFFTEKPEQSDSYGRIVNARHFKRVEKLLTGVKVAIGGVTKEEEKYISPTVVRDCKLSDAVMQEEIFGPVLPIYIVKDDKEAVDFINDREKPLAMYIFSRNQRIIDNFVNNTSSGGMCINDCIMHASMPSLPFGGVGHSGMGAYHGKFSYDTFSHRRSVMQRDLKLDSVNAIRYPPYTEKKFGVINWLTKKSVKKTGVMSFFPLVLFGAVLAFFLKAVGVQARWPALKEQ
ncbi:aldehyde dehydrogenase family 3 member B1-like isoform X1 [Haliotis asinina]|uniref:aldehyde dehydrogenase family 3 member B1-like isoform X1 n=1 Tax=Haliotis asinina TaxID=109174 RepID=UPI003531B287